MTNDISVVLAEYDDTSLIAAHENLHVVEKTAEAVTAHHLVTTEMLARGMDHGHKNDAWASVILEVGKSYGLPIDAATSGMPEDVAKSVKLEVDSDHADVTEILTVNGYALRIDKAEGQSETETPEPEAEDYAEEPMGKTLADVLPPLLADVFGVYLQAHGYHWNVTGPDFTQYHALFGEIASDTYDSIDPLAENLRKVGVSSPWQMSELYGLAEVPESDVVKGVATDLVPELLAANDSLVEELRSAFEVADEQDEQGIANFLAERIDAHMKWSWQLRASLPDYEWSDVGKSGFEQVVKHPGHPSQAVHAGGRGGAQVASPAVSDSAGSGLSSSEVKGLAGSLSKKGASAAYNDGYDEAQRMKAGGADMTPMVRNRRASLASSKSAHSSAKSTEEKQSYASSALDSAGFLDGVAGKKRAVRRTLFGGYNPLDLATAMKATEIQKHGSHNQQDHAGKRGKGSSGEYKGNALNDPDNPPGASSPEANAAAKATRDKAALSEPAITQDMIDMAGDHGAEMSGLDYRLKSEKSLARKIDDEKGAFEGGADEAAADMSDVVRYTMIFDDKQYTAGVEGVLADLESKGYQTRVKNYWDDGDPYQGINVAAIHPDGTKFELQFHTPTSQDFKDGVQHLAYEKYRVTDDPRVRWEAWHGSTRATSQIPKPSQYQRLLGIGQRKSQPYTPTRSGGPGVLLNPDGSTRPA